MSFRSIRRPPDDPAFACRRLPVFPNRARFDSYRRVLQDYVAALRRRGVDVLETELTPLERGDGTVAGYATQAVIPAQSLNGASSPANCARNSAGPLSVLTMSSQSRGAARNVNL